MANKKRRIASTFPLDRNSDDLYSETKPTDHASSDTEDNKDCGKMAIPPRSTHSDTDRSVCSLPPDEKTVD